MIYKVILFLLLSLHVALVSAEETKAGSAVDVFDYTSCSAFFAVMAQQMDNPEARRRFNAMSENLIDYAILLEDKNFSGNTADDMALKLMQRMQKDEESAKYVVRQYLPHCRDLLEKIAVKGVPTAGV